MNSETRQHRALALASRLIVSSEQPLCMLLPVGIDWDAALVAPSVAITDDWRLAECACGRGISVAAILEERLVRWIMPAMAPATRAVSLGVCANG